jgi:hypothetical protein
MRETPAATTTLILRLVPIRSTAHILGVELSLANKEMGGERVAFAARDNDGLFFVPKIFESSIERRS